MLIICKSRNFIFQKIIQTGAKTFTSKVGKLSPYEVNQVLTANEYTREFDGGPVKSFDTNQLGSVGFFLFSKTFLLFPTSQSTQFIYKVHFRQCQVQELTKMKRAK